MIRNVSHLHIMAIGLTFMLNSGCVSNREAAEAPSQRADILISGFEGADYGDWKVVGNAFGSKPATGALPGQKQVTGFKGKGLVNSFLNKDQSTGSLTSPAFVIERDYINMLIGGGKDRKLVGVVVMIDGDVVGGAGGIDAEHLMPASIPVKEHKGKKAAVAIYDKSTGGWGHINVDHITQSDQKVGLEQVEKEIKITKKLLLFPIGRGAGQEVSVTVDGIKMHQLAGKLAMSKKDIAWWGYLDMSDAIGKTATVSFKDTIDGDLKDMIECADEPLFLKPVYTEARRPQFHFSQMQGWNNDPNGMTYYDGNYHLFWQCNPFGNNWGNMYWGHAYSPDMVTWTEVKRTLRPFGRKTPLDQRHPTMAYGHCFSGGGHVDKNNTSGWKTGDKDVMFLMFTDTSSGEAIAYSTDGGKNFTFWKKNPMFKNRGRDPKPVWYEPGKHWVCAVFNQENGRNISFWSSKDLKTWTRNGRINGFFECPELFELPVDGNTNNKKWVIFGAKPDYLIGDFDGKNFTPINQPKRTTIHGSIYAGQCFNNAPDGRVVYIGWARIGMGNAPFNQGFSIPINFELKTLKDGKIHLFANPIKEIDKLHDGTAIDVSNKELNSANSVFEQAVPGQLYDVRLTLAKKGAPKFAKIRIGGYVLHYDFATETANKKPAPMTDGKVDIRVLVDRPFLEVFLADGYSYELVNRRSDDLGKISVSVGAPEGSCVVIESLKAYKMKSIWKQ